MRKIVLSLAITLLTSLASAQSIVYRYDAKYVCGKQASPPNNFVPGVYSTSINVYSNPGVHQFRKRFTVSLVNEKYGGTTGWIVNNLSMGRSLQIDCDNILAHLHAANVPIPSGQVTEGFVIIESPVKLDVVAFFSAGPQNGPVSTLLMERVPAAQ